MWICVNHVEITTLWLEEALSSVFCLFLFFFTGLTNIIFEGIKETKHRVCRSGSV